MRTSLASLLSTLSCIALMLAVAIPAGAQAPPVPAATATDPASSAQPAKPTPAGEKPANENRWNDLATAECRDGTFFHGRPGQGACLDHGGIQQWLRGSPG